MSKLKKGNYPFFLLTFLISAMIFGSLMFNNITELNFNHNSDDVNLSINDKFELKLANKAPNIPQLLTPANESFDTSNIVKFDWTDIGNPSDDIFYEFVMDNDTDFSSPEAARFAINDWSNSTMTEEPYTTFLAHFNDTLKSEEAEDPLMASGLSYVPGKYGKGIFVNASSNAALGYNITDNFDLSMGTIEFWVKLENDLADVADYLFFFDYVMTAPPFNDNITRFSIAVEPVTHRVFAISAINDTYYILIPNEETEWKAGEWHHICMTWGNNMSRLYLDGIEEAVSTYFPIGTGNYDNKFHLGSQLGWGNWINATFDEVRISSIERLPLWKQDSIKVNVTYFGLPFHRYPIWNLNKSEYTHMFEQDDTYYWKVRAHNSSGPGEWSQKRVLTVNRELDIKYQVEIEVIDKYGVPIPNVNLSYYQKTLNKLMGIDANYVAEKIENGDEWFHEGSKIDIYNFFGKRKSNSFRTRLWTNEGGKNCLENATQMAKWAQGNGSIPYLVIFLSDDWAAIDNQPIPKIFEGLSFEERLAEVEEYSKNVTQHFIDEGVNMEFYEIGNEIDFGLCGVYATDKDPRYNLTWLRENIWYNESRIINASIKGIRQVDPTAKIMLHIAISDPAFATAFYTAMRDYGVPYNIIGLSHHPVAGGDGSNNGFKETVKILSSSGLPGSNQIVIPETSYSSQNNGSIYFIYWNRSITGFPLTPEGQKSWVLYQLEWNYQHPNVVGMNYWSPEFYDTIWEGFSWFNMTGQNKGISKPVVDAYPEFFNLRNVSISGWNYSNNNGLFFVDAYRGILELNIKYGNYNELFNITISPFRDNDFIINLSINISPIINIKSPNINSTFGKKAPDFDIEIIDPYVDTKWYTLNGGITNYTFTTLTETINQTAWDELSEGLIIIRFYANDSDGKVGYREITVIKRIPKIVIVGDDDDDDDKDEPNAIPIFYLILVIGLISIISVILIKKLLLPSRDKKIKSNNSDLSKIYIN